MKKILILCVVLMTSSMYSYSQEVQSFSISKDAIHNDKGYLLIGEMKNGVFVPEKNFKDVTNSKLLVTLSEYFLGRKVKLVLPQLLCETKEINDHEIMTGSQPQRAVPANVVLEITSIPKEFSKTNSVKRVFVEIKIK